MNRDNTWQWEFLGFESNAEGQPVQRWFDGLDPNDRYELTDLLNYLQNTLHWPDKVFDPLKGARGISEIKPNDMKGFRNGVYKEITYRIYGWFGPEKGEYTFLHGTEKEVKNDTIGKRIAEGRLGELLRQAARTHKFIYARRSARKDTEQSRRPN